MAQLEGRWIREGTITPSKVDTSSTFTFQGIDVTIDSSVLRNSYVGGDLFVVGSINHGGGGDTTIFGNSTVLGNSYVGGDSLFMGNSLVMGNERVQGNFTVNGYTYVVGSSTVEGDLTVNGNSIVDEDSTVLGSSHVGGDLLVDGDVAFIGNSYVGGTSRVVGSSIVGVDSTVLGSSHVGGDLLVDGDTALMGNSYVGGTARVVGRFLVDADSTVLGSLYVGGNISGPGGIFLQTTNTFTVTVSNGTSTIMTATAKYTINADVVTVYFPLIYGSVGGISGDVYYQDIPTEIQISEANVVQHPYQPIIMRVNSMPMIGGLHISNGAQWWLTPGLTNNGNMWNVSDSFVISAFCVTYKKV